MSNDNELIKRTQTMAKLVDSQYQVIAVFHLNKEKEIMLSDNENPRKCRFCGRSYPEVTFRKTAHAISQMVENRFLKSDYECDVCNGIFSGYETDFSAFMNLYHTMFMIHGKGGIPKFKNGSSNFSKIQVVDNSIQVQIKEDEEPLVIWEEDDKANNSIKIVGKRTYTPCNVLKAIVKMALSIAPKEEMPNFSQTIDWLMNRNCEGLMLPVVLRMYRNQLPFTSCFLLKKKEDITVACPEYMFVLAYRNIVIQAAIPFIEADKKYKGQQVNFPILPTPLDDYQKPFFIQNIRLSSSEKVRGERVEIGLSYSSIEEKGINPPSDKP